MEVRGSIPRQINFEAADKVIGDPMDLVGYSASERRFSRSSTRLRARAALPKNAAYRLARFFLFHQNGHDPRFGRHPGGIPLLK